MTGHSRVVVEADGGARGNPGPAGWGAVVRDADSGRVVRESSEAIGIATNNVAEYRGLIAGLQAAADLGATEVEVRMDSKLVIEQMSGRWKIKHPGLRPLAAQAADLVRRFDRVRWQWVPRERNRDADRLANEAMDAAQRDRGRSAQRGPGKAERPPPAAATDTTAAGAAAADAGAAAAEARPAVDAGAAAASPYRTGGWEPPATTPTRLMLVRHGETELTAQRRYSGRGDVPLSASGRTQAAAVARRLADLTPAVTAVVTSPLSRCVDTAAVIVAAVGAPPIVVDEDLVECDFGQWEGLTYGEVRQRWPAELAGWQRDTGVAPPGGESFGQVSARVRRAVVRLREAYPRTGVVVVSHVSPLKLMLRDALAAGDAFLRRLYLDPGGISVVDSYADGAVAVRAVNDTAHLAAGAGGGQGPQSKV